MCALSPLLLYSSRCGGSFFLFFFFLGYVSLNYGDRSTCKTCSTSGCAFFSFFSAKFGMSWSAAVKRYLHKICVSSFMTLQENNYAKCTCIGPQFQLKPFGKWEQSHETMNGVLVWRCQWLVGGIPSNSGQTVTSPFRDFVLLCGIKIMTRRIYLSVR